MRGLISVYQKFFTIGGNVLFKKIGQALIVCSVASLLYCSAVFANTTVKVTCDALNIRSIASTSGKILGACYNGDKLNVISNEGAWLKITYNGLTGYVNASYVTSSTQTASRSGVERVTNSGSSGVSSTKGNQIVEYAKTLTGIPYKYGGKSPSTGFDCSGFVGYVYAHFGINIKGSSYTQMNMGRKVSQSELKPGDLVFFREGGHVGIYTGNGNYIHSPQAGRTVSNEAMSRPLYTARRIVD